MGDGGSAEEGFAMVPKLGISGQCGGRYPRVCRATLPIIPCSLWGRSGDMMNRMKADFNRVDSSTLTRACPATAIGVPAASTRVTLSAFMMSSCASSAES